MFCRFYLKNVQKQRVILIFAIEAPKTPAVELIANKYREHYKSELVNGIIDRADEIVKLPYKQMFFNQLKRDSANCINM